MPQFRTETKDYLTRLLGFRVVDNRVEFVTINDKNEIVVRATHPTQEWQRRLWDECVTQATMVMQHQFAKSSVNQIEVR
jgi:hypothetical protein